MNGYCIKKGNIGLLHLHNRIMILNEDKDSYCRMIGRGLMIMGLGALISSLLSACLNNENYLFILLASSAIGVMNIPWWRSHPIHENRATESICTEPCNPLLRATKSMKRATSTY